MGWRVVRDRRRCKALALAFDLVEQRRIQRAQIGAAGGDPVVGLRRGGRRPAPEILRIGEALTDQSRADELAVHLRSGCPRPATGNATLRDAGDDERIGDAAAPMSSATKRLTAGRTLSCEHESLLLQAQPAADSTMSISLMPGNGHDDAAQPIDQQIPAQQRARAERPVLHALDGERNQAAR